MNKKVEICAFPEHVQILKALYSFGDIRQVHVNFEEI